MPILSDQDKKTLETRFKKDLKRDVTLTLFTARSFGGLILPGRECQTCDQTQELLTEITEISSHINLTIKDFYAEAEEAQERGIDRIPCITLQAEGDEPSNLLFYGIPAGFGSSATVTGGTFDRLKRRNRRRTWHKRNFLR